MRLNVQVELVNKDMNSLSVLLLVIIFQSVLVAGRTRNFSDEDNQLLPLSNNVCDDNQGKLICGDCNNLGICLNSSTLVVINDCSVFGQVCSQGACVAEAAECRGTSKTSCFSEGLFPDLRDCSRYVECAGPNTVAEEHKCPCGTRFNACTQRCDVAWAGACPWDTAEDVCSSAGLLGVAPENDRLFYTCGLTPDGAVELRWSRCELGHFDPTSLRCVNADVGGCQGVADGGSTTTTTEPTTTSPTTPLLPTENCVVGEVYARPETDYSYYFCKPDYTYLIVECNNGFHFDATVGSCVLGKCNDEFIY